MCVFHGLSKCNCIFACIWFELLPRKGSFGLGFQRCNFFLCRDRSVTICICMGLVVFLLGIQI